MKKIIDSYLVKQFLLTFIFIQGGVMMLCLLVDVAEKFDLFIESKAPIDAIVFEYYPSFLLFWGNLLSPISVFLSVVFFTSRLAGRSELVPMLSAGVSFYRLLAPYVLIALLMSGVSFYLKSFLVPDFTAIRLDFEYEYMPKRRISSNRHVHKKVAPDTYVYISYYNENKKEGSNFALEKFEGDRIETKMRAKRIVWIDSTESWLLQDQVEVRHFDVDGLEERLDFRENIDTTFVLTPDDIYIKEQWAESMTLPDLLEYIDLEEMRGSDILRELYIERHRRFSDPVAILILTLIGFAMSSRKRRGGIAIQIGLGLLICFFYVALLIIGQSLVGDDVPTWAGVWLANLVFFPFSLWLLRQAPK